ncbi:tyrosine-protein phosphatase non-receptor type 11-like isoform X2 [Halichondria panicea]|uniref:tyrosine-protein phosphatase non-receptor type 11-like isoform X2 n=1 Tax=Halichondria panicea TaxID=6063 RepID=UPI00312B48AE
MQSSSHSSLESLKNIHISPFRPGKLVREISSSAKLGSSSFPHPVKILTKDSSTGSLLSIYDDQSESSQDTLSDGVGSTVSTNRSIDEDYFTCYQWYVGRLNRLEAEQCLEGLRNGTYLVRRTVGKTPEYTHAIAVRWNDQPFHIRLYKRDKSFSVANFHCNKFPTVEDLVTHFQDNSLSANFPAIATKLLHPYHEEIGRLEDVSPEQYDGGQPCFSIGICAVDGSVQLIEQEWYHGKLCRGDAEKILSNQPDHSFLLRDSESVPGGYSLSIRDGHCGSYVHLRICYQKGEYVLGHYSKPFQTLPQMVAYYCEHSLNVKGIPNLSLKYPVSR